MPVDQRAFAPERSTGLSRLSTVPRASSEIPNLTGQALSAGRLGARGAASLTGGQIPAGYASTLPVLGGFANLFASGTPGGREGAVRIGTTALAGGGAAAGGAIGGSAGGPIGALIGAGLGYALQRFLPEEVNPYARKGERTMTAGATADELTRALSQGNLNATLSGGGRAGDLLATLMAGNLSGQYEAHPWGWKRNPGLQSGLSRLTGAGYNPNSPFDFQRLNSPGELIAAGHPVNPQPWLSTDAWDELVRLVNQGITGQETGSLQPAPIHPVDSGFATEPAWSRVMGTPAGNEPTSGIGGEYIFGSGTFAPNPVAQAALKYTLGTRPETFGLTPDLLQRIAAEDPEATQTYHEGTGEMRPAIYGGLTSDQIRLLLGLDPGTYGPDAAGVSSRELGEQASARHNMRFASS